MKRLDAAETQRAKNNWDKIERCALNGDRGAQLKLVSEIRRYRAASVAADETLRLVHGFEDDAAREKALRDYALDLMLEAHTEAMRQVLPEG